MILGLTNSKGGVGKTTIAVHLAVWLAEQGREVAFVDSDAQGSSSTWLAEAAPKMNTIRLVTSADILNELPKIAADAEWVIVDGPAGLYEVTRSIFALSQIVLLPCGPCVVDLRAAISAQNVIRQIQEHRNGLPIDVVIPNKLQQYTLSKDLLKTVRNMGMRVGNGLSLRQAYPEAAGQGTVVWRMKTESARAATAEMQMLFQELISYESNPPKHDRRAASAAT